MTRLLLIRHGQSANNAQPEHLRVCDPDLTMIGVQQAHATAQHLKQFSITHLYCSPFLRALETIRPIAVAHELAVNVRPNIFEQGGCYSGYGESGKRGEPGMGFSELQKKYPDWQIDPAIAESGWWGKDYETYEDASIRAEAVADWIVTEIAHQPGLHAMVIHADFKALLVPAILTRGNRQIEIGEPLNNVGITEFAWTTERWDLRSLNSVNHLTSDLVTC